MMFRYLILLLLLFPVRLLAQRDLAGSRTGSLYTYIYKISPKEAGTLYRSDLDKWNDKYLHTLKDSFPSDLSEDQQKYRLDSLPPGNYLLTCAKKNRLEIRLRTVGELQYDLLQGARGLSLALHDRSGSYITDAIVHVGHRSLNYDARTNSYSCGKKSFHGIIAVDYRQTTWYFPVTNQQEYNRYREDQNDKPFLKRLASLPPLSFITKPVKQWQTRKKNPYQYQFRSFMAFSKPTYRPGDTLNGKAFIADHKGRLLNRPLRLRLITNQTVALDTILTMVTPYRKGGYSFSFPLSNGLGLRLNDYYNVQLEIPRRQEKNSNDEEDDDYAIDRHRRKTLVSGRFFCADYELKSLRFLVRQDQEDHSPGNPIVLYCSATDDNKTPILDGRIRITLVTTQWGEKEFLTPHVYLKDTLWNVTLPLDMVGETRIIIPDSIFPAASFKYGIHCKLLNSSNESISKSLYGNFDGHEPTISFTTIADSLRIEQRKKNKPVAAKAVITALSAQGDTIGSYSMDLPALLRINLYASEYVVKTKEVLGHYLVNTKNFPLVCTADRTKDSIRISVANPCHLHFWYTLYTGNRILRRGYTDSLRIAGPPPNSKNYTIALQCIWGGKNLIERYSVPYLDKMLNLNILAPESLSPGDETDISILVRDAEGHPVEHADVTAYAVTAKFERLSIPFVPYLGKYPESLIRHADFRTGEELEDYNSERLNWRRWSDPMRLDTMIYYQFLHPEPLFVNHEPIADGLTQVAPFVSRNGALETVHQVYIDEKPVYFRNAGTWQPYSFLLTPGRHSFRLRTAHSLIRIDSLWIASGMKTIFSLKDTLPQKMPDTLTPGEKNNWSNRMIRVDAAYGDRLAMIRQGNHITLLNYRDGWVLPVTSILAGPFSSTEATLEVKGKFSQSFYPEGGYTFTIANGLIKQKQMSDGLFLPSRLLAGEAMENLHDRALTSAATDSIWQAFLQKRNETVDLFTPNRREREGNGELTIRIDSATLPTKASVENIFLFRYDDPDFIQGYKGNTRNLGFLPPGVYRLLILLPQDLYLIRDSIIVLPDGTNYYLLDKLSLHPADEVGRGIGDIVRGLEEGTLATMNSSEVQGLKQTFHGKYLDPGKFPNQVSGRVISADGKPLQGVTIKISSTLFGTITGPGGYFFLRTPDKGKLLFSYVGYRMESRAIDQEGYYVVKMEESKAFLDDVVVTAYGITTQRMATGSISSVGTGINIMLHGLSLPKKNPLYKMKSSIPSDFFTKTPSSGEMTDNEDLHKSAARQDHGQIRKNFHDSAFWQPALSTDAQGIATFHVRFPDDITNWQTFALAFTDHHQTGYTRDSIRAIKKISANISLPRFLISGDSTNIVGKLLNYTMDTVRLERTFSIEGKPVRQTSMSFFNAVIDSFPLGAGPMDSLHVQYSIRTDKGYLDGEERAIPVYRQGIEETNGLFAVLDRDSSLVIDPATIPSPSGKDPLHIRVESTAIPAMLDEVEHISSYLYLCNEQLASKLKALLLKDSVCRLMGTHFREQAQVRTLIYRLKRSRSQEVLWGWWKENEPAWWITIHATEALLMAGNAGYAVDMDQRQLINRTMAILQSDELSLSDRMRAIRLLRLLDARADYPELTRSAAKQLETINAIAGRKDSTVRKPSLYEKLQLMELQQDAGLPIAPARLVALHRSTAFGAWYWGEDNREFFDNAVLNTVKVYRIMRKIGGQENILARIRQYFLEQRRDGHWTNTYTSCLILETILPDLLQAQGKMTTDHLAPAKLSLNGTPVISKFPLDTLIQVSGSLQVNKLGDMPLYFTAYRQYWNENPSAHRGIFEVSQRLLVNGQEVSVLQAGQPASVQVTVKVNGDAEYIMIGIPIPAGCSYGEQGQYHTPYEVHREYFRDRVNIFCKKLRVGIYTFEVSLQPRFAGRYHLNPAKAEMMYFPTFYGREAMKTVQIDY